MSELRRELNRAFRDATGQKRPEREEATPTAELLRKLLAQQQAAAPAKRERSTAVIREETAQEIARHTVRWTAFGVLAASFLGAALAFNGSPPSPWWDIRQLSLLAIVAGVVLQAFCTLMEWANRKQRRSPKYLGPLLLDIGSTYLGFAPLLVPVFQGALERAGVAGLLAAVIAHAAVVVGAWWSAFYPETNLVK